MSYHEYLEIDRKTVTKTATPTTLAKRYIYDGNVDRGPHRQYIGLWRPVENSQVINGVIVHASEIEADDSQALRRMIVQREGQRVNDLCTEIRRASGKLSELVARMNNLQQELHEAEDRFKKIGEAESLSDILCIRAEGRKTKW